MKHANAIRLTVAAAIVAIASTAQAGSKLEKVDMVAEGIDLKPAIVRANSNGYTSYENSGHTYLLRLFAKAKGANRIYWAGVSTDKIGPFQPQQPFFKQTAGKSEGWGVYKKSVSVNAAFAHTQWFVSPKDACTANLKAQMNKGVSKANVLKKEWKTTAKAKLFFVAAADSKSHNKKGDHDFVSSDEASRFVSYNLPVVCRAAL